MRSIGLRRGGITGSQRLDIGRRGAARWLDHQSNQAGPSNQHLHDSTFSVREESTKSNCNTFGGLGVFPRTTTAGSIRNDEEVKEKACPVQSVDAVYCQADQPAPEESVEQNKISPDQLHSVEDGKTPDNSNMYTGSGGMMKLEEVGVEPSD